jgi:alpha-beta hydrolase superfamily lysophospholipase
MPYQPATFGPAPALVAAAPEPRGTVLLLHGLGGDALAHTRELDLIRRAGFTAIGLDAPCHGRRHDPERDHRWATDREGELVRLVHAAGAELPAVVDAVIDAGLPGPIGVVGISLGAYSTWVGLVHEPRIRAAVPLLGSPHTDHPDSAHLNLHALHGRAILAINAQEDEVVPLGPTGHVMRQLDPSRAAMRLIAGARHEVPEVDWWLAWGRALEWLDQHLVPT